MGSRGIPSAICDTFDVDPPSLQTPDPTTGKLPYTGTIQTIGAVAKSGGALSLWSGFLPYYGRCGGHTVAMFIAVDQLRVLYKKYQ